MSLRCYHCGASLDSLSLPFSRLDECPECTRQLHVCRMCVHYDIRETSKQCREDDAEEMRDKQAANFCDYFVPSQHTFSPEGLRAEEGARKALDGLFGEPVDTHSEAHGETTDEAVAKAEQLFRK
jgi:hypothetical protein